VFEEDKTTLKLSVMASKLEIKDVLIESESGNYSEDSDAMQSTAEQRQRLFRSGITNFSVELKLEGYIIH